MSAVATSIKVTVHYPPASKPFKDDNADPSETVGQLKARVLTAFDLTEGTLPDGNVVTYPLFHGKSVLENMSGTIASLADDKKVLQLKLTQQLTQGYGGSTV